jgi:hypothetical protein
MENDLLTEIRQDIKEAKRKKRLGIVEPKKVVKKSIKGKVITILILLAVLAFGVAYGLEKYADWRAEHQWQFPTKWIGLVTEIESNKVQAAETKPLTDMQVIEQYKLAPVVKTVYFLESTSGKNDRCKDEGKFNGFGYRQNKADWKCYESFEQVADKVNEWFEDRLAMNGNNLVEAICFYNRGIQGMNVCDYSENFMGVLTKNF